MILIYIALYILLYFCTLHFVINTIKNWYNNEIKYTKWSESLTIGQVETAPYLCLIPFVLLLVTLHVYKSKYWTFKKIHILNP